MTWVQNSSSIVTSTTVAFMSASDMNNMTCNTNSCLIHALMPCRRYNFTVIPRNKCGSANCSENMATADPQGQSNSALQLRLNILCI